MDRPLFVRHYSALLRGLRRCGLSTPWISKPSLVSRLPFIIYDTFLVAIVVYMLCCFCYTINAISMPFQELCGLGVCTSNFLCAVLVTLHLGRSRNHLNKITDDMDEIAERILRSDLTGADFLQQQYVKNAKLMAILTNNSIFLSFTLPLIYCIPVPVTDWLEGKYRSRHSFRIENPFDDKLPGVYELIAIVLGLSIVFSTSKKSATDCLFVSLFNIQTDFLKYLSVAMAALQQELLTVNDNLVRRKLILWLELHQDILRNIQELVEIFSPVVIIYYMTTIGIIVCGAFVQSMKENEHVVQSICIGGYVTVTLIYYYLLSNTAEELTAEAEKLAFVAYSMPWYDMNKSNANMIQFIVTISNRPIQVTANRAPAFLLNRETFAKFLVGAISAFVTLCKMQMQYG